VNFSRAETESLSTSCPHQRRKEGKKKGGRENAKDMHCVELFEIASILHNDSFIIFNLLSCRQVSPLSTTLWLSLFLAFCLGGCLYTH
jgi:hypothetical protein